MMLIGEGDGSYSLLHVNILVTEYNGLVVYSLGAFPRTSRTVSCPPSYHGQAQKRDVGDG